MSWFDLTEVRRFAAEFVDDLCRVRAGADARGDRAGAVARRVDKLIERAAQFEREQGLNFYKKARLIALVRAGLQQRQLPEPDVQVVVQRLLGTRLLAAAGGPPAPR